MSWFLFLKVNANRFLLCGSYWRDRNSRIKRFKTGTASAFGLKILVQGLNRGGVYQF